MRKNRGFYHDYSHCVLNSFNETKKDNLLFFYKNKGLCAFKFFKDAATSLCKLDKQYSNKKKFNLLQRNLKMVIVNAILGSLRVKC